MQKIISSKKPFKRLLKIIIPIIVVGAIVIPIWSFLDSIHYKIGYLFVAGPDHNSGVKNFGEHKKEFELLVKEIDRFVNDNPNFFEEFTGECYIREEGLIFTKVESYQDNQYLFQVNTVGWEAVENYIEVFPPDFQYGGIFIDRNYPAYIMFRANREMSAQIFVYTKGERPSKLIDSYWEKYDFVYVDRIASGWYDIYPIG